MDIKALVNVTSRAWSLDILALMHGGVPGRQATLLSASGAGRTAFVQSLAHLVDLGLLERNPGHGHPLRPEFRLTAQGADVARVADSIRNAVPRVLEHDLLRRTWTVPILAVSQEPRYFTEIKNELVTISDRALSQSLKQLHEQRWLQRKIDPANYPPRPLYQTIGVGARISRALISKVL
jgi:DNA-binding HxlR family transcriptional regulator